MKKILVFSFVLIFIATSNAFAASPLRQPQGRLGTSYKTEKYNPYFKTNITPTGLANLGLSLNRSDADKKKEELVQKQAEKQRLAQEKRKQELAKQKAQQDALAKEQAEKQRLAQEQRKQELAKQKAQQDAFAKEQAEKQRLAQEQNISDTNENQLSFVDKMKNKFNGSQEKEVAKTPEEKLNFFKKLTSKEIKEEASASLSEQNIIPEKAQTTITTSETNHQQDPLTKSIVNEIQAEISSERTQMLEELSLLWVNAVQKSDTVYFAIMKLSNPNGEEVNKNGVKKILEPILSAAPLVGQAFVNPALTAGSLIGSNVMGTMMNDSANKRLTKVNDADLVILARSIDELQETLLINYLAYKSALKEYELSIKITDSRKSTYDKLNNENSPNVVLANTFYTEALDNQYKARQEFLMKRVVLEQMVGADALNEMEKKSVGLAK